MSEIFIAVKSSGATGKTSVVANISVAGVGNVPKSPESSRTLIEAIPSVEVSVLRHASVILRHAPA